MVKGYFIGIDGIERKLEINLKAKREHDNTEDEKKKLHLKMYDDITIYDSNGDDDDGKK